MNEDEITNLKLMICHLDLSVETKEKLYNQTHKIRNQLQQKENIIKEVREWVVEHSFSNGISSTTFFMPNSYANELLEILDKEIKNG